MFIFGLCFILYFLKLSGTNGCMLKGKTLLDYTNLFSPNDFKKNDQIIKRIFKNE